MISSSLTQAPAWINDLILYEIATKGYTSPAGPESGTFDSLYEKLPYLHDLGITGIWLSGHSLSDPRHFYNIWTQYACILPDQLDPSLGDAAALRRLIDRAHVLGIKVLLDVITHGVMSDSPLIQEHPDWFKGGSWGMTDYDWFGNHPDLDNWWVELWLRYVTEFGIDGFRLDVAIYRPDLWSRIRQQAAAAGHPIVVLAELGPGFTGATDFLQWGQRLSINHGFVHDHPHLFDVAAAIQAQIQPAHADFQVWIDFSDGSQASNVEGAALPITVAVDNEREVLRNGPDGRGPYLVRELTLAVSGVPADKVINNITVRHASNFWPWCIQGSPGPDFTVTVTQAAPDLRLVIPARFPHDQWLSVQLSCHDNGWDGFPLDQNAYAAQGSRFVFGYSFLLTPAVPIFMGGEEFNADYVPLPTHTPGLFGTGTPGTGRWLYASWLQWDQLADPERAALLEDVKRLIRIRRSQSTLIRPLRVGSPVSHLLRVPYQAEVALPGPYLYCGAGQALLVAGNPHADQDVSIRFDLPFEQLGIAADQLLTATDLWSEKPSLQISPAEFQQYTFLIQRDKRTRGGMLVVSLTWTA